LIYMKYLPYTRLTMRAASKGPEARKVIAFLGNSGSRSMLSATEPNIV